jgi:hypothetical protein
MCDNHKQYIAHSITNLNVTPSIINGNLFLVADDNVIWLLGRKDKTLPYNKHNMIVVCIDCAIKYNDLEYCNDDIDDTFISTSGSSVDIDDQTKHELKLLRYKLSGVYRYTKYLRGKWSKILNLTK